jgi:hypothetical protein
MKAMKHPTTAIAPCRYTVNTTEVEACSKIVRIYICAEITNGYVLYLMMEEFVTWFSVIYYCFRYSYTTSRCFKLRCTVVGKSESPGVSYTEGCEECKPWKSCARDTEGKIVQRMYMIRILGLHITDTTLRSTLLLEQFAKDNDKTKTNYWRGI